MTVLRANNSLAHLVKRLFCFSRLWVQALAAACVVYFINFVPYLLKDYSYNNFYDASPIVVMF